MFRKFIFALVMAIIFFVLLNFIYCNLDSATFGYKVSFKFEIPYLMAVKSMPMPLGFVLLATFCLGMVGLVVFESLPSIFKTIQIRAKNKRIKELEREVKVLRDMEEGDEESEVEKDNDVNV